jgi:sec-independent protein translocase protein TatA
MLWHAQCVNHARGCVQVQWRGAIVTIRLDCRDRLNGEPPCQLRHTRGLAPEGGLHVFGFGLQELVIVLVIALVIFGGKKLPELGSGLGKAIREFKRGTSEPDEIDVTPKETTEQKEPAEPSEKGKTS